MNSKKLDRKKLTWEALKKADEKLKRLRKSDNIEEINRITGEDNWICDGLFPLTQMSPLTQEDLEANAFLDFKERNE